MNVQFSTYYKCFIVSGPGFLDNRRDLSNTGSFVQIYWIDYLFLHSLAGNVGNLRFDCTTFGSTKSEFGHPGLVKQLDGQPQFNSFR